MPIDSAHKSWWQTFEVVVGLPFLVSVSLQLLVPIILPAQFRKPVLILIGAALIIVGLVFIILARREMAKFGQHTDPGHPTGLVISTGIFSISRNPLYLGGICLLLGIALVANLTWFFILFLPTLIACHYVLIAPEEKYLSVKFGEGYARYAARVNRWIGYKRNPSR